MHYRSLGLLSVGALVLAQFASLSAAQAGPKSQHNSTVKAQCISEGKAKGLTGKALHDDVVGCFQKSGFSH